MRKSKRRKTNRHIGPKKMGGEMRKTTRRTEGSWRVIFQKRKKKKRKTTRKTEGTWRVVLQKRKRKKRKTTRKTEGTSKNKKYKRERPLDGRKVLGALFLRFAGAAALIAAALIAPSLMCLPCVCFCVTIPCVWFCAMERERARERGCL